MQCNLSEAQSLTVGQLFEINCRAVAAAPDFTELDPEKIELRLSEADQHKLKILKAEKFSATEMKLTVTSYKAGDHDLKAVQIIENGKSYVLGDLKYTVTSVINPQEPPAEPFPSQGPFTVSLPLWYWVVGAAVVLLVVFQIYWRIRQKAQKKKLLQEMQIDGFAADPLAQFFQTLRKQQRSYAFFSGGASSPEEIITFVSELEKAFKLYIGRVFKVPAYFWSSRKVLKDIRKNYRREYDLVGPVIRKALAELSRAQNAKGQMSAQDCMQLNDLIRKQVDEIQRARV